MKGLGQSTNVEELRAGIPSFFKRENATGQYIKRGIKQRLNESYLYGEIHVDDLDSDVTDRFTSEEKVYKIMILCM